MMARRMFPVMMVVAMVMAFTSLAVAQTFSAYNTTHSYWFTGVTGLPAVSQFGYTAQARAFEPAPGWDVDFISGGAMIVGPGSFSVQARAGTDRPKPGFGDAGATASVSASVNTWGAGWIWNATMTSSGIAHAQWWPDRADAFSTLSTRIWAPRTWQNGRIIWRPVVQDSVSGAASANGRRIRPVRNTDPIHVSGLDEFNNPIWTESFFDVNFESSGDVNWTDTGMVINDSAGQVDMLLEMATNSSFVTNPGSLKLEIRDGMVTRSESAGRFADVGLPSVATFVGGHLSLSGLTNEFAFDYDLSSLQGNQLDFLLDGSGYGEATGVPEPGSLLALSGGLMGLAGMIIRRRR